MCGHIDTAREGKTAAMTLVSPFDGFGQYATPFAFHLLGRKKNRFMQRFWLADTNAVASNTCNPVPSKKRTAIASGILGFWDFGILGCGYFRIEDAASS